MEDQKEKKPIEHLEKVKEKATENRVAKLSAIKAAKSLDNGDSQWSLVQEMLQEIMAGHTVTDPENLPPLTQMTEELKKEIETKFAQEPETKQLLLEAIPAVETIRKWVKKDGWSEAVWGRIRADGLFNAQNRAKVIKALMERALDKSDVAAKIWLTLSGDYSEKMEVDNKSVDQYREINKILHRKKED